ncbi:hypothetical protein Csa_023514, partial [Cucumis sativus]
KIECLQGKYSSVAETRMLGSETLLVLALLSILGVKVEDPHSKIGCPQEK